MGILLIKSVMGKDQGKAEPSCSPQGERPQEERMLGMKKVQLQSGKKICDPRGERKGQGVLMMRGNPKGGKSKYPFLLSLISGIGGGEDKNSMSSVLELPREDLNGGGKTIDQGLIIAGEDADVKASP